MTAWPADAAIDTTDADQDTDSPLSFRADALAAINLINGIRTTVTAGATVYSSGNSGAGNGQDSDLLDGQHGSYYLDGANFTAASVSLDALQIFFEGAIIIGDATNRPAGLSIKDDTKILIGNGTTAVMQALSGDVTMNNAGAVTIGAGKIDAGKIAADQIDSQHYAAGSIDAEHIAADQIDSQHYAAGSIDSEHYAAGSVNAAAIGVDAVGQSEIAAGAVHQGELDTETSTGATTGHEVFLMAGGEYSFFPQVKTANAAAASVLIAQSYQDAMNEGLMSTSFQTLFSLHSNDGISVTFQNRYINSSPPYNLGDGDIPFFVFVKMSKNGVPVSVSCAGAPPWAYNGPTRITADRVNKKGEKFQIKTRVIDRESGTIERTMVPITHKIKNADMGLIPHPFSKAKNGESIIILDPPETLKLFNLNEAQEPISDFIMGGDLIIDNAKLSRKTPFGVSAHGWKWKKT